MNRNSTSTMHKNNCRRISFYRADAAGNVTLFVTSHVDEQDYIEVAHRLLAIDEIDGEKIKGEQVAFVVDEDTMCMCGHEFCGNASRSFALMKSRGLICAPDPDRTPRGLIRINVSGSDRPLDVLADVASGFTRIRMPDIVGIEKLSDQASTNDNAGDSFIRSIADSSIAHIKGISHVIVRGIEATLDNFSMIRDYIFDLYGYLPAIGVMFVSNAEQTGPSLTDAAEAGSAANEMPQAIIMTPVVYVTEADTTFFEGSCGSGTTALCSALSTGKDDGTYHYDVKQPKGTIRCSCTVRKGLVTEVYIEGPVSISGKYSLRF